MYVARTTTWRESEPKVAEFAPAADVSAVAAPELIVAADPDIESYPLEAPQNAPADAGPDKNISPIREGVEQPEVSPVIVENTVHNDGAANPFENKFVIPLSTVRSDDEDIDIPEPLTAGMNRAEAGRLAPSSIFCLVTRHSGSIDLFSIKQNDFAAFGFAMAFVEAECFQHRLVAC